MQINNLYEINEYENPDSEIIAMTMVVKDSLSGELQIYNVDEYGNLNKHSVQ